MKNGAAAEPSRYDTAFLSLQIVRAAETLYGIDRASLLECAQVPPGLLEQPMRPLPLAMGSRLVECAVEQTQDPLLGLRAGLQTHLPRALGLAGLFITHAPTQHAWMENAVTLQNSASNVGTLSLEPQDKFVNLRLRRRVEACVYTDQIMEFHVGLAMSLSRRRTDSRTKPCAVELLAERLERVGRGVYEEALGCDIVPTQGHTGARYHFGSLHVELDADRDVYDVLCPLVEREVATLPSLEGVRDLVTAALERSFVSHGRPLSLDAVALMLGLSGRTLQQRLQAEGTSLQRLVDDVRRHLAVAWLEQGRSREEVSARLGYSESSAFRRAWRRWGV